MHLLRLLGEKNIIDQSNITQYEGIAAEKGISYERVLLDEGVDAEAILRTLGEHFGVPTEAIRENERIDSGILKYIPEESARHYSIIPLRIEGGVLLVGTTDPENYTLRDALNFMTAKHALPYKIVVLLERDLERGLQSYENLAGEVNEALVELESELTLDEEGFSTGQSAREQLEHIKEDAPVTKIVATMLRYAVEAKASDIHIEPSERDTQVRFRIDGLLTKSLELPKKVHPAVVARSKILSSLRLDERRKPQDGRFSAGIDNRKIDFRVSLLPTNHGEKVVMRILDTQKGVRTLEETGVSKHTIELIREAVRKPYGIILISGPTGSGKSTTLYAMLAEIDRAQKNVLSLEDPVEYNIDGVSQSQVRPEIGYTFATGLRSALRQDPDVIMVGEIRDKETAQLAIQAALTGHLVLSTIHTNNAIGVIPRLIDMGVDPYLIAPTLRLALAQRLVRRICPGTGKEIPLEGSVKRMIDNAFADVPETHRMHVPKGEHMLLTEATAECPSGTRGRIAVMEAVAINDKIETLILNNASENDIYKAARADGFLSMKEDAIIKALAHAIPFEEVSALSGDILAGDFSPEKETEQTSVDNPQKHETGNV